jgi:hypothetical protein
MINQVSMLSVSDLDLHDVGNGSGWFAASLGAPKSHFVSRSLGLFDMRYLSGKDVASNVSGNFSRYNHAHDRFSLRSLRVF